MWKAKYKVCHYPFFAPEKLKVQKMENGSSLLTQWQLPLNTMMSSRGDIRNYQ